VQSSTDPPRNDHLTSAGPQHDVTKPSLSVSHVVAAFRLRPCTGGGAGGSEDEAVGWEGVERRGRRDGDAYEVRAAVGHSAARHRALTVLEAPWAVRCLALATFQGLLRPFEVF
jgi:hypothetical protein